MITKEDQEALQGFVSAALQGWMSRYPEDENISRINYNIVANGVMKMALTMYRTYKQTLHAIK